MTAGIGANFRTQGRKDAKMDGQTDLEVEIVI